MDDTRRSQAFDACLKEALALTREWMPRWLLQLQTTLRERESSARSNDEKQSLARARIALEAQRDPIASGFLAALAESVERSLPRAGGGGLRPLQSVKFDELELMGDDQVQETVELARVQQIVLMSVDEEQLALTALLSTAQGLEAVNPDANPLRGEVVVAALMQALKSARVEPAVRARWLQAGAVSLGRELRDTYVHLAQWLRRLGVKPAGFAVVQAPASRAPVAAAPAAAAVPARDAPAAQSADSLLTLDHLHQLLVGNLEQGSRGQGSGGDAQAGSGDAMVRTLASEVVSLMLKRIAADERLLPSVREMLQEMKPALQQLARTEPRFFADRQNPARRMLDAITERSLAFTSEHDQGYGLFAAQVRKILEAVRQPGPDLPARLEQRLDELNRLQTEAVAPAQVQARGLAVQTLVRVEQRNLLAERVAAEIRSRPDFDQAPEVVRRFLNSTWPQVIAQARLEVSDKAPAVKPGESPAARYTDVLSDLLWSSQTAQASLNRTRLAKVIPYVLRTLREGLDSIEYPREQSEPFFLALMGLHAAACKTVPNAPPREEPALPGTAPADLDDEPWIPRTEARDSCLMDDAWLEEPAAAPAPPSFQDTVPMPRDWAQIKAERTARQPPGGGAASSLSAVLPVGTWVDIVQDGQAMRWQITWASPHGTLFLFTGGGGRSLSMTRRGLERLIEQNRMRVIADHGVVDEALDEVARQAWLNSGRG